MPYSVTSNGEATFTADDIVGDAGSKSRLAAIAGAVGHNKASAGLTSSKIEGVKKHLGRALKLLAVGQAAKAVAAATAALQVDERYGQTWHVMAIALEKSGDLEKAFTAYEAAVRLLPDDAAIVEDLGKLAHRLGFLDLAEKLYQKALAMTPGQREVTNNLACVLRDDNRYGEAIDILKVALAVHPESALLWNTLGTVVSDQGEMAGSVVFYEEAIRLDSKFYSARYNLANIRVALGEPERALTEIDGALKGAKTPHDIATMKTAKAFTQMLLGDLVEGFATYEARFDPALSDAVEFQPHGKRWSPGEPLQGKTLLIYGEQGLGDEILFANLLGDVVQAVGPEGQVMLAIEGRLVPMFSRSYPSITAQAHRTVLHQGRTHRFIEFGAESPAIDLWTPLGSLFRTFRTSRDDFPAEPAFLKADPARVAHWREVLGSQNSAPKIGFLWKSLNMKGARARGFTPFDLWQPVLATEGVQFVNLQYGDCSAELTQAEAVDLNIWTPPGIDLKADLDDVAALCSALDLMVGPMTATMNIAAACGVPSWVVSMPDAWPRFGTDGFPCYPSVRLFPADGFGDWDGVMARIRAALQSEIAGVRVGTAAAA